MAAQLYSAELLDVSQPVKRRTKKEKVAEAPPTPADTASETTPSEASLPPKKRKREVQAAPEVKTEPTETPTVQEKVKKPRTEKQIAALEKAKEARRLKKEAIEKEKKEKEAQMEAKRLAQEQKKEAAKQRRREAAAAKKEAMKLVSSEPLPKPKVHVKQSKNEPPQWFRKYVEGVKQEQTKINGDKKPIKQVRQEADSEAQTKWDDGPTRDRVTHEVDNHMNRMYGMIFGQRRAMNK